ncbi:hypothetical protein AB8616_21385 [Marinomonas sp. RS-M-Aa-14]|uniref:hypothetical protein n=1 Tax=Marinomonas sp. RS-M-Aa-14 TaxID=3241169 RepID=UPI00390C6B64
MRSILKTGISLILLSNISNILNYIQMIFISRSLTKQDLSIFASVTATGNTLSSFLFVIPSIYVIAFNAKELSDGREKAMVISQLNTLVLSVSLFFFFLLSFFSIPISRFLNIESALPMFVYSFCLLNTLLLQIFVGHCQGLQKFNLVQVQVLFLVVIKVIMTYIFFEVFGYDVYSVLYAELIATVLSTLFLYMRLKPIIFAFDKSFSLIRGFVLKSTPVAINFFIVGSLLSSDLILAKYLFSPSLVADYSVSSNLGKIAFFVSGGVSGVVFAMIKGEVSQWGSSLKILILASLASFLCGSVVILCSVIFPSEIIGLLFGEKFLSSAESFQILSFSMTILSVNVVIFGYLMAVNEYTYIKYTLVILLLYFVFAMSGMIDSPINLSLLVALMMLFLLFSNIFCLFKVFKGKSKKSI